MRSAEFSPVVLLLMTSCSKEERKSFKTRPKSVFLKTSFTEFIKHNMNFVSLYTVYAKQSQHAVAFGMVYVAYYFRMLSLYFYQIWRKTDEKYSDIPLSYIV